jgi:hypothetical protein
VAIYRCEAKAISRGQGRSCVAAAAYRHACELVDERQGMTHDYSRKGHVEHSEIIAPEDAPAWVSDRAALWNRADAAEKRKDAITARELLLTLPRELSRAQQVELVHGFCAQFTERRIVADVALHAPDGLSADPETGEVHEQCHAHVMLTDRALDGDGFASRKDRTLAGADGIEAVRASWAEHVNTALERAGIDQRVDHRSLERQRADAVARGDELEAERLNRTPEPKIGPVAAVMVRDGRADQARAWQDVRQVREARTIRERLVDQWHAIRREAAELRRQIADEARAIAASLAPSPLLAGAGGPVVAGQTQVPASPPPTPQPQSLREAMTRAAQVAARPRSLGIGEAVARAAEAAVRPLMARNRHKEPPAPLQPPPSAPQRPPQPPSSPEDWHVAPARPAAVQPFYAEPTPEGRQKAAARAGGLSAEDLHLRMTANAAMEKAYAGNPAMAAALPALRVGTEILVTEIARRERERPGSDWTREVGTPQVPTRPRRPSNDRDR